MRGIVYTDSAGVGGAEISLGHLVKTAAEEIDLTVVGVSQAVVEAVAAGRSQAATIVLPDAGLPSLLAHLSTFHRLQPDLIHLNLCTPWAGTVGLVAALSVPRARVVRVDQLPLRTTDLWTWLRVRLPSLRVDAHVAVGVASSRRMEDFYALGRNTVVSIPNGVPDQQFSEAVSLPSTDGWLQVGSVGRLDPMKGHDVLLRALAQVERTRLVILGEGAFRPQLEQLAAELGIQDRVKLLGWVAQPRPYLSTFDVIAQPSRSEGFPLTVVEAMLASRPIIATRVGSVAEAIAHEDTGLLIEKDDVEGLAAALRRLRDDSALRERLGERARAIASAQFTVTHMTHQYEALWQKLLSQPQKSRLWIPRPRD
ncbi:MAG: glycosyltransferase [Cyanobacteria bacterium Co-bin13]|nr:glycosyltransferase [Cyanobacteria bacterium Co-bin13]